MHHRLRAPHPHTSPRSPRNGARYVNDHFSPTHQPTVGIDFFIKEIALESGRSGSPSDSCVRVQLWDIAGQDRSKKVNRVRGKITPKFDGSSPIVQGYWPDCAKWYLCVEVCVAFCSLGSILHLSGSHRPVLIWMLLSN